MGRDDYSFQVFNTDPTAGEESPDRPAIAITVEESFDALSDRLRGPDGDLLTGADVDLAYRHRTETAGVLSITTRLTGEYILECNVDGEPIAAFVEAARRYGETGDDAGYDVHILRDGDRVVSYEKRTFLVYDRDGNLRREESLIPSGVEL